MFVAIAVGVFGIAVAAVISVDAGAAPCSEVEVAKGIESSFPVPLGIAALAGLIGMYRSFHDVASLPRGSTINITWHDGGKEKARVTCLVVDACV